MIPAPKLPTPPFGNLNWISTPETLRLKVGLPLMEFEFLGSGKKHLGLSAVLEYQNLELSYWALCHPGAQPDFHHPNSFVIEL